MAQHTPGPWHVVPSVTIGDRGYGPPCVQPVDSETHLQRTGSGGARSYTRHICQFDGLDDDWANALLIAAAPELLSAAESTVAGLDGRVHSTPALHALADLRAAIAKARGDAS